MSVAVTDSVRSWIEIYAGLGWHLTPIHEAIPGGGCTCGPTAKCTQERTEGKHPRLSGWRDQNCTADLARLMAWDWGNIGMICDRSGVLILDFDIRAGVEDGIGEFQRMLSARGLELPVTARSRTGGGGEHVFLAWDSEVLGPAPNGKLHEYAMDFCWKNMVLLPPSLHRSGQRYEWINDPRSTPPVMPSLELVALLRDLSKGTRGGAGGVGALLAKALVDGPRLGERDDVFNAYAYQLKKDGRSRDEAEQLMHALWLKAEQTAQDKYPWEAAQTKLIRVYTDDSIEPDPVPANLAAWAASLNQPRHPDAPPDPAAAPHTDTANGYRFATLGVNRLMWVPQAARRGDGWYVFDGQRWVRDLHQQHVATAQDVVTVIQREATQAASEGSTELAGRLAAWARESAQSGRVSATHRFGQRLLTVSAGQLDQRGWLLNTPGGVVNLEQPGGIPRAASPDDLLTRLTQVTPAPVGTTGAAWMAFLETALPDPEVRSYVQEAIGYSLVGVTSEKVIFVICGPTGTGKTIFTETINRVLGDYATTVPTQYIAPAGPGGGEDRLRLFTLLKGARLALCSEPESGARLSVAAVKDLTGGHRVSARDLFESAVSYVPEVTLWLDTNHFPKVEDFDDSIWEKLRVIPFEVEWPEERRLPRDEVLHTLVVEEGEAVLRWALDGLARWLAGGKRLVEPPSVKAARVEEREEQDWIGEFLTEVAVHEPDAWVTLAELYGAYQRWAMLRGTVHLWTQTRLTRELKRGHGTTVGRRAGTRGLVGLRLRRYEDGV